MPSTVPLAARLRAPLAALAVFAFAALWFALAAPPRAEPFEVDEAEWIAISIHSWQLATTGASVDAGATDGERRAAAADPWRLGIQESTFGWMYPLIPKLAFGAAAAASGMDSTTRRIFPRFHPAGLARPRADYNRARARFLPAASAARAVTVALAAGVAAALFALGWRLGGWPAGFAAAALWLAAPTARAVAVWVRADLFPLWFGLAALLLVCARGPELCGARGPRRAVAWAAVLGLVCGAAVGSKLNGALFSFMVPAWLLVAWLAVPRERRPSALAPLGALLVTGVVCAGVFWATMPGLWGEPPLAATGELLSSWKASLARMSRQGPADLAAPTALAPKLGLVLERVFLGQEPAHALTGVPVGAVLAPLGLAALGLAARRRVAARQALVWLAVLAVGTALWIPHDRPRFFLPLLVVAIVLEAVAVGALVARARRGHSRTDVTRAGDVHSALPSA